jgi:hypothetical protein
VEEPAAAPKPPRRTGTTAPQPKPEVAAPPVTPAEPERPIIQEIVPPDEQKRYQEAAQGIKREIRQILDRAKTHRLNSDQTKLVRRINTFVSQSDDAEKRGDMRQAEGYAQRGVVLARELAGAK